MKLLKKSTQFNKMLYTMELSEEEKLLSEGELVNIFKTVVTDEYLGFGYTVTKFENQLTLKIYTD